ncbi:MAG: enoyl-CoA hydratase/isomerase family protein [Rhodospirillales bacterium]|nr:enoyl-CoA hydratase/isomerase family protein [Rhodospirillales bacterium]
MAGEVLQSEDGSGVVTVTLSNPARRNACSLAMWQAIGDIFEALAARSDVRIVILTGAGGHFCAGADISEFATVRDTVEKADIYSAVGNRAARMIRDLPQPSIAAVHGYGVGGGCGLALSCDFRVGGPDTRMGIPAAERGIVYGPEDCALLLRAVGLANAKLVLYSARQFDIEACRAMGLVDLYDAEGALAGARKLAAELATRAPIAQRGAKLVLEALDAGEVDARAAEIRALMERAVTSEDYREAGRAFMEKRRAVFQGR